MNNPWINLPETSPFILTSDWVDVYKYQSKLKLKISAERDSNRKQELAKRLVHEELLPEPFLGNPDAPIVLLNGNPGFDETDRHFHQRDRVFMEKSRANLIHDNDATYPFYLLDPAVSRAGGYQWWLEKLKQPINQFGQSSVARSFFCVEYFPYHSGKAPTGLTVKSQTYGFSLVKHAVERKALVILMRSERLWLDAVPELHGYERYYKLQNPQNVVISQNNCPTGYQEIINQLR
jgi:hypothetical protein